ncbi:sulfite exporter TauE/SafE family protein [Conservatibacter flavescens]|uniref:Probable membrane transporter protein n=1 Tax=Conservatibacter flavescens TaxID=28161 RepID=A0A2M8S160_9PAST|nr:sulfite exporter TauE/SafE family protein [Conservatibacter flavescens]PJG84891.1 sulfite exporter TauE/SafE family protein [Conservatibacter flavescens]
MDMLTIIIAIIIALGSFTQGLTGFGLALISVPLLSLFIDVKLAVPIAGIFGWLVTFPIVWKMRAHIQWRIAIVLFIGSLPGSYLGADLLKQLSPQIILMLMGIVLIFASLYSLYSQKVLFKSSSNSLSLFVGFCSGALGASVGEPGPPVIAYTSMLPLNKDQTKSTLVCFFMLQMIGAISGFWSKGLLTNDVLLYVIKTIPLFIIGLYLGMFIYQLLNKYSINYHRIIYSILLIVGGILIIKSILFT